MYIDPIDPYYNVLNSSYTVHTIQWTGGLKIDSPAKKIKPQDGSEDVVQIGAPGEGAPSLRSPRHAWIRE